MKKKNKNYPGMTIIEMMVAISIFTIGIAGFSMLFMRVWQGNSYTFEMGQSAMAVSQGVNQIVEYIRGARQSDIGYYPIVSASGNDLVLYADYDKDTTVERLHIYKSGTDILMGVTDPDPAETDGYPSGDTSTTTVAQRIVNDVDSPIFYYFDKTYYGGEGQTPMVEGSIHIADIRLVKIHLYINIDPNRAPDNIEMQSFVELRNLNDYNNTE